MAMHTKEEVERGEKGEMRTSKRGMGVGRQGFTQEGGRGSPF